MRPSKPARMDRVNQVVQEVLADDFAFVRNVLNENPLVTRADLSFGGPPHGYTAQTLLPRTVGVTMTYRY